MDPFQKEQQFTSQFSSLNKIDYKDSFVHRKGSGLNYSAGSDAVLNKFRSNIAAHTGKPLMTTSMQQRHEKLQMTTTTIPPTATLQTRNQDLFNRLNSLADDSQENQSSQKVSNAAGTN